jgi:hypothetical protein
VKTGTQHVHRIDVKHLVRMEACPNPLEAQNCAAPLVRLRGEHRRGNTARRGSDNDLKGVARAR